MQTWSFALCAALCVAPAFCQPQEIPFESVANWLKLPEGFNFGEAAGIAVNSKGHYFVYTRAAHTQLLEFDQNGKMLREIGKDLYGFVFAHVVRIDKDDNIWCVDEGSNMVIEFNPEGHVMMTIGRRAEPSEAPPQPGVTPPARANSFNRPTDIQWDSDGNGYITDGYGNSRVAKVDKYGRWITAWGKRGTEPGEFHTPHTLAIDAQNRIFVGDRENNRIQVFDTSGKFLKQFTNVGAPWAVCITPGPKQVLYSSDSRPGRIYKMDLDGNILGVFGHDGKRPGEFGWIHEMACPSENTIYAAEILNWRVQKLTLHPVSSK
ncbi:MAG TPA: peptidyl-alpha-hydroxyglycine alpha-amidating lyase family protein [Bryobacteraceae bacterium]|nr:peptidyl-alpha-hydroxyglycine alpha-amidating lyase family protein [Bryobacteraceae bacterium]